MKLIVIKKRMIWYIISLILIVPGIISLLVQGLNFGIDFTGGNMLDVQFVQQVDSGTLRTTLKDLNIDASIQEAGTNKFIIKTKELSEAESTKLVSDISSKLGKLDVNRNEKVSGTVGQELAGKALLALGLASIGMIIYITLRFELNFALAAVLSLIHDLLVVVGVFSIFQFEIDGTFIAAILTILGYSINDTIVIFDRIRENMNLNFNEKKDSLADLTDLSIRQTIFRSLITGVSVIFCLVSILIFGGETIKMFSLAMLIGVVVGAYSSIFNAAPMWYDFRRLLKKS